MQQRCSSRLDAAEVPSKAYAVDKLVVQISKAQMLLLYLYTLQKCRLGLMASTLDFDFAVLVFLLCCVTQTQHQAINQYYNHSFHACSRSTNPSQQHQVSSASFHCVAQPVPDVLVQAVCM